VRLLLAPVTIGTRTGFINKSGRLEFELPFRYAPGFLTGDEESNWFVADSDVSRFFTADDKFGYVNTSGRLFGWSDEGNTESCKGISESMKAAIAQLFPR
jgi:hypothetical protein